MVIESGQRFSRSEIHAAEELAVRGNRVLLRAPRGTRAQGETSDLLVNGDRYDVFTPTSRDPSRIVDAMSKKLRSNQTDGIVLDLSQTTVNASDLGNIPARLAGKGVDMSRYKGTIILPE